MVRSICWNLLSTTLRPVKWGVYGRSALSYVYLYRVCDWWFQSRRSPGQQCCVKFRKLVVPISFALELELCLNVHVTKHSLKIRPGTYERWAYSEMVISVRTGLNGLNPSHSSGSLGSNTNLKLVSRRPAVGCRQRRLLWTILTSKILAINRNVTVRFVDVCRIADFGVYSCQSMHWTYLAVLAHAHTIDTAFVFSIL